MTDDPTVIDDITLGFAGVVEGIVRLIRGRFG